MCILGEPDAPACKYTCTVTKWLNRTRGQRQIKKKTITGEREETVFTYLM
jgi:hypothetical protein